MTIHPHPHPRRAPALETLDDVFTSIISTSSSSVLSAGIQKPKVVDPKKKVDPLTRRLSMINARKREGGAGRVATTIQANGIRAEVTSKAESTGKIETSKLSSSGLTTNR
jgi:hypothetical protein